eukprot:scaffold50869_cov23-Tisochrysis_lutea.AAC.2
MGVEGPGVGGTVVGVDAVEVAFASSSAQRSEQEGGTEARKCVVWSPSWLLLAATSSCRGPAMGVVGSASRCAPCAVSPWMWVLQDCMHASRGVCWHSGYASEHARELYVRAMAGSAFR